MKYSIKPMYEELLSMILKLLFHAIVRYKVNFAIFHTYETLRKHIFMKVTPR